MENLPDTMEMRMCKSINWPVCFPVYDVSVTEPACHWTRGPDGALQRQADMPPREPPEAIQSFRP